MRRSVTSSWACSTRAACTGTHGSTRSIWAPSRSRTSTTRSPCCQQRSQSQRTPTRTSGTRFPSTTAPFRSFSDVLPAPPSNRSRRRLFEHDHVADHVHVADADHVDVNDHAHLHPGLTLLFCGANRLARASFLAPHAGEGPVKKAGLEDLSRRERQIMDIVYREGRVS